MNNDIVCPPKIMNNHNPRSNNVACPIRATCLHIQTSYFTVHNPLVIAFESICIVSTADLQCTTLLTKTLERWLGHKQTTR